MNVFIAEYLLNRNREEDTLFNTLMGGFTIAEPQPTYSTCNCTGRPLNTGIVDAANALISEKCYGRAPILPLFCNDSTQFLTSLNSSFIIMSLSAPNEAHNCNTSRADLSDLPGCRDTGLCVDPTCSDCAGCKDNSLNSWYGDFETETTASITIWYNNQVGEQ